MPQLNGDTGLPGGEGIAREGGLPPQRLGGLPGGKKGRSFKQGMAQLSSYNPIEKFSRSVFSI